MTSLTPAGLSSLFAERLGTGTFVTSVERGPVGNGQEVWFVDTESDAGTGRFVLRRTAPGGPLDWTDREREFRTLAAVAAAGLPVPHGRWFEPEGGTLDGAYFVMDRLPGDPVRKASRNHRSRVAVDLGLWLARLHGAAIDAGDIGHSTGADAATATREELALWARRYRNDRAAPIPPLGVVLAHLARSLPGGGEQAVLLWGDAGAHNVLHDNGAVTAVLDWELSHFGDPHEDLGSLAWSYGGSGDFDTALAAYEEESGRAMDRDRIRFFEVMACATRSVMLVTATANYLAGRTSAPNLAGLGLQLVPANLERAGRLLGWEPADLPSVAPAGTDPDRIRPDVAELLEGTIRFLVEQALPATDDPVLRRGLKTTEAILATAAHRIVTEPVRNLELRAERAELMAGFRDAGLDVGSGFEDSAIAVETDEAFAPLREELHRHLMADIAVRRALAGPLNDLYGG
jgi:aminoglycoside phosphotransferase (APT) family kinase protein